MKVRQLIRPDIMVSAIAHLSVLALIFVFAEVHRFNGVTTAPIAVDLVAPEEVDKQQAEPAPPPPLPSEATPSPEPTASQPKASPQAAAAPAAIPEQAAHPDRREASSEQKPAPQAPPPPSPAPSPAPSASYTPPEPDLTVKYHVMLGLPDDIPLQPEGAKSSPLDKPGDGIDATASSAADLSSTVIAEFRRHLKTCSRLPAELSPSDKVMIKLRLLMTPQGRLARDPILIEASASAKGPLLMQGAIAALKACQPYDMLPADRYGEWKIIDLSFTPGDFAS
jgi:outer membrane biosynthesis protein TonB